MKKFIVIPEWFARKAWILEFGEIKEIIKETEKAILLEYVDIFDGCKYCCWLPKSIIAIKDEDSIEKTNALLVVEVFGLTSIVRARSVIHQTEKETLLYYTDEFYQKKIEWFRNEDIIGVLNKSSADAVIKEAIEVDYYGVEKELNRIINKAPNGEYDILVALPTAAGIILSRQK